MRHRLSLVPALLIAGAIQSVAFAAPPPADGPGSDPATPRLALPQAIGLALQRQPRLEAASARADAAREQAAAAGRLPDPQLVAGFGNLSVDDPNPYRDDAERMAMTSLGLQQAFPDAEKRRQQRQQAEAEVRIRQARVELERLQTARDAGMAWADVWEAERAQHLLTTLVDAFDTQLRSREIDLRSNLGQQARVHDAEVKQALARDRLRQWQQRERSARARLQRWIGEPAAGATPDTAPELAPAPDPDAADRQLEQHPLLTVSQRQAERATAELALARADYRPDWRVQLSYGYRQPYDDLLSLQFGVDLPLFTRNRQDRRLSAAALNQQAAEADTADHRRALLEALHSAYADWQVTSQRIVDYDRTLLPAAQARSDAALRSYRAGVGAFDAVLTARQDLLDLELLRLNLGAERIRARLQIRYLLSGE